MVEQGQVTSGVALLHEGQSSCLHASAAPYAALDEVTANFGHHGVSVEVIQAIVADHITLNRRSTLDATLPAYLDYGIDF